MGSVAVCSQPFVAKRVVALVGSDAMWMAVGSTVCGNLLRILEIAWPGRPPMDIVQT